ncbi:MAG: hypothetical protein N2111_05325 [Candidatus Sumerlaeaceae bacterium]|nr:hypothetical protein [Candidatus Sumerlaeaceae bacterium]
MTGSSPEEPRVVDVEAVAMVGREQAFDDGRIYIAQSNAPCCSGCGCLLVALLLVLLFELGHVLSAVLIVVGAGWLSVALLRLLRISRYSPAYIYVIVPIFLSLVAALGQWVLGKAPYAVREIVIGTLVIYGVLFLSDRLLRRR